MAPVKAPAAAESWASNEGRSVPASKKGCSVPVVGIAMAEFHQLVQLSLAASRPGPRRPSLFLSWSDNDDDFPSGSTSHHLAGPSSIRPTPAIRHDDSNLNSNGPNGRLGGGFSDADMFFPVRPIGLPQLRYLASCHCWCTGLHLPACPLCCCFL